MSDDGIKKLTELTHGLSGDPYSALQDTFDHSPDLICVISAEGYFTKLSASFTNELGWSPAELMAKPLFDFIHPDDKAPSLACWEKTKAGTRTEIFVNRYLCKSGEYKAIGWALPGLTAGIVLTIGRVQRDK